MINDLTNLQDIQNLIAFGLWYNVVHQGNEQVDTFLINKCISQLRLLINENVGKFLKY